METTLHIALKRSPIPTRVPLSDLIRWMHQRIRAHQDSNTRWRSANPETAKICASNRYYAGKPLKTGIDPSMSEAERRAAKAAYMRNYRAGVRLERAKMERKIKTQNWDRWRAQKAAESAKRKAKWKRRMRKRGLL